MKSATPAAIEPNLHRARSEALFSCRIISVAAVVMAELWALTAAIQAWSGGRTAALGWILGFQMVCFLLAFGLSVATPPQPVVRRILSPIRLRGPVTAE